MMPAAAMSVPVSARIRFTNPTAEAVGRYEDHIRANAALRLPMMQPDVLKGRSVVICGSGPSLNTLWPEVAAAHELGDVICACKGAIQYLHQRGVHIDYSVSIDPGAHLACAERLDRVPGVKYLMASTSNPVVVRYLLDAGCEVTWFHSATGFTAISPRLRLPYNELVLYQALFPQPWHYVTGGFNVVNRAIGCMKYMGASEMRLIGVDCGWRDGEVTYCGNVPELRAKAALDDHGMVDGKPWHTFADMLASGLDLVRVMRDDPSISIMGDTLPGAMLKRIEGMSREEGDHFLHSCGHFE